jgi:mono/diheme cytochrome c family protein
MKAVGDMQFGRKVLLGTALMTASLAAHSQQSAAAAHAPSALLAQKWEFVDKYCGSCHNSLDWAGGVAFDTLDKDNIAPDAKVWEEAVRKLRGSLMPPPGETQPDTTARAAFMKALESALDQSAAANPDPGSVVLHRLNRSEYAHAIKQLLDLDVNAESLLPRDDQSSGFNNVADVLKISPSFLEQYLSAARQVSIEALGNPRARTQSSVYAGSAAALQYMHHEGLPLGTRGGLAIEHWFPADGDYEVTVSGLVGGGYVWGVMDPFELLVTVDGDRVFQGQVGGEEDLRAIDVQQAVGLGAIDDRFRNIKVHVPAGRHSIGVTYKQKTAAEQNEVLHSWVPVAGMSQMVNGNSGGPRISNVEIKGPLKNEGVSDTPSRRKLFICRPQSVAEESPCAEKILGRLAKVAFRRPVNADDLKGALEFYANGRKSGSFDDGIQKGVMAILASPKFLYRFHTPPAGAKPGDIFALNDLDLASRLAFFLWSGPPDEALIDIAAAGRLKDPKTYEAQVRRMLADPKAKSLATNFAGQWLNVGGLDLVNPDTNLFPDYTEDLIPAFREEVFQYVWSIFGEDRNVIDLMTGDWSFLNERLALHYGIKGVRGGEFRRVQMTDQARKGLLGKGAVLMATSYANRTSPVVRGAYVLEHLMGTPPASPPPGVEQFPESQEGAEQFTVRHRLEMHRKAKSCASCHGVIDPVGLAMENFNALGQWRKKDIDAGAGIDSEGRLADGTAVQGVEALRNYIAARPDLFVQTLTENLLTYALGRSAQYYDMPLIRSIVRSAGEHDFRFSSLVMGIATSPAFLSDRAPAEK